MNLLYTVANLCSIKLSITYLDQQYLSREREAFHTPYYLILLTKNARVEIWELLYAKQMLNH